MATSEPPRKRLCCSGTKNMDRCLAISHTLKTVVLRHVELEAVDICNLGEALFPLRTTITRAQLRLRRNDIFETEDPLETSCMLGNRGMILAAVEAHGSALDIGTKLTALRASAQIGTANHLAFVCAALRFQRMDLIAQGVVAAFCTAQSCNLSVVRYLANHFELRDDFVYNLADVVVEGGSGVAEWLVEHYAITDQEVAGSLEGYRYARHVEVMETLLASARLADAQWLEARRGEETTRGVIMASFCGACRSGSLATIRWAYETFGIAVRSDHELADILRHVIASRNARAFEWILNRFGAASAQNLLCIAVDSNASVVTLEYIVDRYAMSASDVRRCRALYLACRGGHLEIVRWLVTQFADAGFTPTEILDACLAAELGRHRDAVDYLCEHYHITHFGDMV